MAQQATTRRELEDMLLQGLVERLKHADWYMTGIAVGLESLNRLHDIAELTYREQTADSEPAKRVRRLKQVHEGLQRFASMTSPQERARLLVGVRAPLEALVRDLADDGSHRTKIKKGFIGQLAADVHLGMRRIKTLEQLKVDVAAFDGFLARKLAGKRKLDDFLDRYRAFASKLGFDDPTVLERPDGLRSVLQAADREITAMHRHMQGLHSRIFSGRARDLSRGSIAGDLAEMQLLSTLARFARDSHTYLTRAASIYGDALELLGQRDKLALLTQLDAEESSSPGRPAPPPLPAAPAPAPKPSVRELIASQAFDEPDGFIGAPEGEDPLTDVVGTILLDEVAEGPVETPSVAAAPVETASAAVARPRVVLDAPSELEQTIVDKRPAAPPARSEATSAPVAIPEASPDSVPRWMAVVAAALADEQEPRGSAAGSPEPPASPTQQTISPAVPAQDGEPSEPAAINASTREAHAPEVSAETAARDSSGDVPSMGDASEIARASTVADANADGPSAPPTTSADIATAAAAEQDAEPAAGELARLRASLTAARAAAVDADAEARRADDALRAAEDALAAATAAEAAAERACKEAQERETQLHDDATSAREDARFAAIAVDDAAERLREAEAMVAKSAGAGVSTDEASASAAESAVLMSAPEATPVASMSPSESTASAPSMPPPSTDDLPEPPAVAQRGGASVVARLTPEELRALAEALVRQGKVSVEEVEAARKKKD